MHTSKTYMTRKCFRCNVVCYWRHHLCKNRACPYWYKREGAAEEACARYRRKLWHMVVAGKGKMHKAIEQIIQNRDIFRDL